MLISLSIKNYILIESLKLDFCKGLNIITGETGAGKSIILGALDLILGNRADTKANFNPSEKCIIEGALNISSYGLRDFFFENDFDYSDITIVRREILPSGKTRAFINDTPANLNQLNELSRQLIDMHQQWDTLEIRETNYQMYILDVLAEHKTLLEEYRRKYQIYHGDRKELQSLMTENVEAKREQDFIQFQLNELEQAQLKVGELEEMEMLLNQLENLEEIKRVLQEGIQFIDLQDRGILDLLRSYTKNLRNIQSLDPKLEDILERVESSMAEILDIRTDSEKLFERFDETNENINEISARVDLLHALLNKHQVNSEEELLKIRNEFQEKTDRFENLDQLIQEMSRKIETTSKWLQETAAKIHENRSRVVPVLEKTITENLQSLAMPHAQLKVRISRKEEPGPAGIDQVEYLFAANKGIEIQPLRKVASGGEISRLNLSLKSLIAGQVNLPSLVFDEIDSGLSGEVAMRVGNILSALSKNHQIISITHSPQVASRADRHFLVYKDHDLKQSRTYISLLQKDARIIEIAKMLSGDPPSTAAIDNAKQLIGQP